MSLTPEELQAVRDRHANIPQEALPLDDVEWPAAVQHAHYRGRLSDQRGVVLGPMLQMQPGDAPQHLTVVEQSYDPVTDTTRLGLTYGLVVPTQPEERS